MADEDHIVDFPVWKTTACARMRAESKTLAEAGLPPADDDERDEREEREIDIYSEPPEIDTTRADPPPSKLRVGLLCCCFPFVGFLAVLLVSVVLYTAEHAQCTASDVLGHLRLFNSSQLDSELRSVYDDCVNGTR